MELNEEGLAILSTFDEEVPVFMMNYINYNAIVSSTGRTEKKRIKNI